MKNKLFIEVIDVKRVYYKKNNIIIVCIGKLSPKFEGIFNISINKKVWNMIENKLIKEALKGLLKKACEEDYKEGIKRGDIKKYTSGFVERKCQKKIKRKK